METRQRPSPDRDEGSPGHPARPRDAASLVITRRHGKELQVLVGRREPRDRFMPDVYVFPGGRVDRADAGRTAATELRPEVADNPEISSSPSRARALAIAAIRETYEETGLVVGELVGDRLFPALDRLDYVARAITPSMNPIRYHARFFHTDAAGMGGEIRSNGELLDLDWVSISDALELPIIDVTAFVLREVAARHAGNASPGHPLIYYRGIQQHVRRRAARRVAAL